MPIQRKPKVPCEWELLEERELTSCRVFRVLEKDFRHPTRERTNSFYTLDLADWAVAIALTPEGEVVLVRQFRFGSQRLSWELPAGCVHPGEDPVDAAVRELREETGFATDSARLIGTCHPNPALQSNTCHFVLCEAATHRHPTEWDPDEELETRLASIDETLTMAIDGRISHAICLNAVLFMKMALEGKV